MKSMKSLVAAGIFLALTTTTAAASARSYSLPTDGAHAISACLADGQSCGKAAADHFCQKAGYAESVMFSRATVPAAKVLDSGMACAGKTCEAFTRIKCYKPTSADQANAL